MNTYLSHYGTYPQSKSGGRWCLPSLEELSNSLSPSRQDVHMTFGRWTSEFGFRLAFPCFCMRRRFFWLIGWRLPRLLFLQHHTQARILHSLWVSVSFLLLIFFPLALGILQITHSVVWFGHVYLLSFHNIDCITPFLAVKYEIHQCP